MCQFAVQRCVASICCASCLARGLFLVCHRMYVVMLLKVAILRVHLLASQFRALCLSCYLLVATLATLNVVTV